MTPMICEKEHKFILHDGESVCGKCGFVDPKEADIYVNERQSTVENHNPVNYGKLVRIGSQHDYVSKANTGLCFQMNGYAKDFQGHRTIPQLSDAYVTGQVVEKGSRAYTLYDLFEEEKSNNPNLMWADFVKKRKQESESQGEEFEEGKIRAKKMITDDSIYRNAFEALHDVAVKFNLNRDAIMELDKRVRKVHSEWVSQSDVILHIALTDLIAECPGFGLERHKITDGINNSTYLPDYIKKELKPIGAHLRNRIMGALNVCETGIKIPAK